jgi:hypothetical protein
MRITPLAGIFEYPRDGVTTKADIKIVDNMVKDYIQESRTMCVIGWERHSSCHPKTPLPLSYISSSMLLLTK